MEPSVLAQVTELMRVSQTQSRLSARTQKVVITVKLSRV
jgi:hypothetical protein